MEKTTISIEKANDILKDLNVEIVPNTSERYEIYKSFSEDFYREDTRNFLENRLGYINFSEEYLEKFYKIAKRIYDRQGDMTFVECLENVDTSLL